MAYIDAAPPSPIVATAPRAHWYRVPGKRRCAPIQHRKKCCPGRAAFLMGDIGGGTGGGIGGGEFSFSGAHGASFGLTTTWGAGLAFGGTGGLPPPFVGPLTPIMKPPAAVPAPVVGTGLPAVIFLAVVLALMRRRMIIDRW